MQKEQTDFYAQLHSFFERVCVDTSLKSVRKKAFDGFLNLGLPSQDMQAFQYISFKNLFQEKLALSETHSFSQSEIDKLICEEAKGSYLVFVNGFFQPSLSNLTTLPHNVVVMPLDQAMGSYGTVLNNRWNKILLEDKDPFTTLNLALHPKGVFVYVPPKTVLKDPIQCLFLSTDREQLSLPRMQVFIASQSEAKFITSTATQGFSNSVIDVTLEERSRLCYLDMSLPLYRSGRSFSCVRATLKKESYLSALSLFPQRDLTRCNFQVDLIGEGAEASLQGSWYLKEKEEMHIYATVRHEAALCRSMQTFKGVLSDRSVSSFEGKIFVTSQAQKTEAYQLNNNLIIGEYASANSKPNLEIFADDVKASHGATTAQLDQEELFYLKSRGIQEEAAKNLLIQGFVGEFIQQIPYPSIQKVMVRYVKDSAYSL